MPNVAFAPIFIAWLGFDIESKVAPAAFIAPRPIAVSIAAGLHAAGENARMLFETTGAAPEPRGASRRSPQAARRRKT